MKKKSHYFDWVPIRRLMQKSGADLVARDAVDQLLDYLERSAQDIASKAAEITKAAKRKKVTAEDIRNAMR